MLLFQKKISSGNFVNRRLNQKWTTLLNSIRGLNFFRILTDAGNVASSKLGKARQTTNFSNDLPQYGRTLISSEYSLTARLNAVSSSFLIFDSAPLSLGPQKRVFSHSYKPLPQLFLNRWGTLLFAREFGLNTTLIFWLNIFLIQLILFIFFVALIYTYIYLLHGIWGWELIYTHQLLYCYFADLVLQIKLGGISPANFLNMGIYNLHSWVAAWPDFNALVFNKQPANVFNWTPSIFFQDFEIVISYTEVINSLFVNFFSEGARIYFFTFLFSLVLSIIFFFLLTRTSLLRADAWQFFFNFSYHISFAGRLQSLEVLNQLTRNKISAIVKNKDFFAENLYSHQRTPKTTIFTFLCFEYYFSQTVGGFAGFADLFPSHTYFHNELVVTKARIKTFLFFNKIRGVLSKKLRFIGSVAAIRYLVSKRINRFKSPAIKKPEVITDFLAPRLYLESEFTWFYSNFDWLFNISKIGDYGVLKLRRYFFKTAVLGRDPWDDLDSSEGRDHPRAKMSFSPQKTNWYGRELSSVSLSKSLVTQFSLRSLFRFRFKRHNAVNDFSFWKPESNYTGYRTYFSPWDTFSVQNDFDINLLGGSKFDLFERSSSDEDDEFHPEYMFEDAEVFFEDGLLHKDFELIFFDHEFDDLIVKGQLDDYIEELEENLKWKSVLTNESLIYKAGQEGDYSLKTTGDHYSGYYSLEYANNSQYTRRVFDSLYDDLSDFMVLNSCTILPRIFGIPNARSLFYWGGSHRLYGNFEINERYRRGRFLHLYWKFFTSVISSNYYAKWCYNLFTLILSTFFISVASFAAVTWALTEYLIPADFALIDLVLLFVALCCCVILVISAAPLLHKYQFKNILRYKLISFWTRWGTYTGFVFLSWFFIKIMSTSWTRAFLPVTSKSIQRQDTHVNAPFYPRLDLFQNYWGLYDRPHALNFFFGSYNVFRGFKWVFGVSDKSFLNKIDEYGAPSYFTSSIITNKRRRDMAYPILLKQFTPQFSQFILAYSSLFDSTSLKITSRYPLLLYDFQSFYNTERVFIGCGLSNANFVFGNFLQDNLRILRKISLAEQPLNFLSHGLVDSAQLRALTLFKRFATKQPNLYWSDMLSDFLFGLTHYPVVGLYRQRSLSNVLRPAGLENAILTTGLLKKRGALVGADSRARISHFEFFASRSKSHPQSVYTVAYENFLRLFFSKQLLRDTYSSRSGSPGATLDSWPYRSKIRFTTYATPLHFFQNSEKF